MSIKETITPPFDETEMKQNKSF